MSKYEQQRDQDVSRSLRSEWWRAGAYATGPAVFLWMTARLPGEFVASVAGAPSATIWLNQVGDTLFVLGWLASAAWLWTTRGRTEPARKSGVPHRAATPNETPS